MKKALPYIIAFIAGLFARTIAANLGGIPYTMDGHDWLVGLVCIVMVWSFKGAFLPRKSAERRRKSPRENPDSLRGKPDRML